MPIGKVWIYRLLLVLVISLCMVTYFSAEDKASGVKFCTAVHRCPRQGISHFGERCSPQAQNRTNRLGRIARVARAMAAHRAHARWAAMARACAQATRRIGMCGYTVVTKTNYLFTYLLLPRNIIMLDAC